MTKETEKYFTGGKKKDKTWNIFPTVYKSDAKRIFLATDGLKVQFGCQGCNLSELRDSQTNLVFLSVPDSSITGDNIHANICLHALVHAEIFAAQVAFLCDLFIFFVQKNF